MDPKVEEYLSEELLNALQLLESRIGDTVHECYGEKSYDHTVEGFKIDSTGIYVLLKGGHSLNAVHAFL